jgi:hypothetical protein
VPGAVGARRTGIEDKAPSRVTCTALAVCSSSSTSSAGPSLWSW